MVVMEGILFVFPPHFTVNLSEVNLFRFTDSKMLFVALIGLVN